MKRSAQSAEQAVTLQLLVRLRVAAGVNQTALAARLGITQSEVSKFERGERALDRQRLRAWLHVLGVEWAPPGSPHFSGQTEAALNDLFAASGTTKSTRILSPGFSVDTS